jgi:hypothetical protein
LFSVTYEGCGASTSRQAAGAIQGATFLRRRRSSTGVAGSWRGASSRHLAAALPNRIEARAMGRASSGRPAGATPLNAAATARIFVTFERLAWRRRRAATIF